MATVTIKSNFFQRKGNLKEGSTHSEEELNRMGLCIIWPKLTDVFIKPLTDKVPVCLILPEEGQYQLIASATHNEFKGD